MNPGPPGFFLPDKSPFDSFPGSVNGTLIFGLPTSVFKLLLYFFTLSGFFFMKSPQLFTPDFPAGFFI